MANPFIASRVYLKPLLPGETFAADPEVMLRKAKTDLLRRIKRKLTQTTFSDRAKKAFAKAIQIQIKQSSIVVVAAHPGFGPLLKGQRKMQMRWLTKAKRPIPIVTESGKLIFRNATSRSMENGKWRHPGRQASSFVEKAKQESRTFLRAKFSKELRGQVRKAWSR